MYVSGKERKTHVFIAKHQNSKIVYVDPQTGDRVNIDRRLNLTVKGMTEISGIDNLKPSKYINGCVRRRKDDKQKTTKTVRTGQGKRINLIGSSDVKEKHLDREPPPSYFGRYDKNHKPNHKEELVLRRKLKGYLLNPAKS